MLNNIYEFTDSDIENYIFDTSDECLHAACGYANKSKEKCEQIIGKTIFDKFYFKILFKPSHTSFSLKRKFIRLNLTDNCFGSLYYLVLDKYQSVEDFINNHSKLITFL